ncbi:ATP-binding protein [Haloplasma contractile]|uniref:histidine kinase n=1 Tax=Haloplasma contractile SSD-17B TaxID=1033810 RepID=U2FDP0_9MOLU|nr:sensor histidine kinase [Haloplasma contractile]ERJ11095.1 two-component system sensor histidine kinase FlrB protein [Haloplasma contractile SSD-17B]
MRDLSMHVLDICMNSVRAKATFLEVLIEQQKEYLNLTIRDNGIGMDESTLKRVIDPFYTTRKTRHVGLGIPLLKASSERCKGEFSISSHVNKGTLIKSSFLYNHIDCLPIGDIQETFITLIMVEPDIDYLFKYNVSGHKIEIDTRKMRKILSEVPLNSPLVINWLKKELNSIKK